MSSIEDLRELFESFCSFGSSRNLATGSTSNMDEMLLDGQKFAKLCKDAKIIDGKKITTTEVDIVFNKCKAKGQRKMDWDSFLVAFRSLAEKKYPSQNSNDAYRTLMGHVCDKCPIAHGTIPQTNGVYDKLTDISGYTGTHKQRFNSDGTGKGIEGRDQPSKTKNLSTMVERTSGTVAANKSQPNLSGSSGRVQTAGTSVGQPKKRGQTSVLTASSDKLDVRSQQPKRPPLEKSNGTLKSQSNVSRSSGNVSENKNYTTGSNSNLKGSSGSVFDRLTDVNGYTGAHKHRFNADGSGRGLTGRDAPSLGGNPGPYRGGDVKDLAQILRS